MEQRVNKRIAKTILHALAGGMVPDNGLQYIAVGRRDEVAAIDQDMEHEAEGCLRNRKELYGKAH